MVIAKNTKFKEIIIYGTEKFYIVVYANSSNEFDSQLPKFEESINSFEILSQNTSNDETMNEISNEENGGCLIATATFGSEMAPQI